MKKTILITGATDGIGLETATLLVEQGHNVVIHGRNPQKLEKVLQSLGEKTDGNFIDGFVADLSVITNVKKLAEEITAKYDALDVLINNAGVFTTADTVTSDGLDVRFAVNTIAPYLLTKMLMPLFGSQSRILNLSSAAQAPVSAEALLGCAKVSDNSAYAQSKLALTMWSRTLGIPLKHDGPKIIAVNPGSMLATKMVKTAYGVDGADIRIGADILIKIAFSDEFEAASGEYYDNDYGHLASPHPDGLNDAKSAEVIRIIEAIITEALG